MFWNTKTLLKTYSSPDKVKCSEMSAEKYLRLDTDTITKKLLVRDFVLRCLCVSERSHNDRKELYASLKEVFDMASYQECLLENFPECLRYPIHSTPPKRFGPMLYDYCDAILARDCSSIAKTLADITARFSRISTKRALNAGYVIQERSPYISKEALEEYSSRLLASLSEYNLEGSFKVDDDRLRDDERLELETEYLKQSKASMEASRKKRELNERGSGFVKLSEELYALSWKIDDLNGIPYNTNKYDSFTEAQMCEEIKKLKAHLQSRVLITRVETVSKPCRVVKRRNPVTILSPKPNVEQSSNHTNNHASNHLTTIKQVAEHIHSCRNIPLLKEDRRGQFRSAENVLANTIYKDLLVSNSLEKAREHLPFLEGMEIRVYNYIIGKIHKSATNPKFFDKYLLQYECLLADCAVTIDDKEVIRDNMIGKKTSTQLAGPTGARRSNGERTPTKEWEAELFEGVKIVEYKSIKRALSGANSLTYYKTLGDLLNSRCLNILKHFANLERSHVVCAHNAQLYASSGRLKYKAKYDKMILLMEIARMRLQYLKEHVKLMSLSTVMNMSSISHSIDRIQVLLNELDCILPDKIVMDLSSGRHACTKVDFMIHYKVMYVDVVLPAVARVIKQYDECSWLITSAMSDKFLLLCKEVKLTRLLRKNGYGIFKYNPDKILNNKLVYNVIETPGLSQAEYITGELKKLILTIDQRSALENLANLNEMLSYVSESGDVNKELINKITATITVVIGELRGTSGDDRNKLKYKVCNTVDLRDSLNI